MLSIREFLAEAADDMAAPQGAKLKHLTHVDRLPINMGHAGVGMSAQHLEDVSKVLSGGNSSSVVDTKYDGAPSIVFGIHPQTKQFFVASKSAFNKDPKINYTPEDIERNHGHAPGLVEKLKAALEHLPKIMPRTGGVYQGDLMQAGPSDLETNKGMVSMRPNLIRYSAPVGSPEGRGMLNSKLGVVVHTKYSGGPGLENMAAGPLDQKTRDKFNNHPDVDNIDPKLDINPDNYTPAERQAFLMHMAEAKKVYGKVKPEAFDELLGKSENTTPYVRSLAAQEDKTGVNPLSTIIETHINKMVRDGGEPTAEGLINQLREKHEKELTKLVSPAGRDKKAAQQAEVLQHFINNSHHLNRAFQLQRHLSDAKHVLVGVMAKNSPYAHSYSDGQGNDVPTGPEGAVVKDKFGNMSKLVDTTPTGFASTNLRGMGAIAGAKAQPSQAEQPAPPVLAPPKPDLKEQTYSFLRHFKSLNEKEEPHHVISQSRSFLTQGHMGMHNFASKLANEYKAGITSIFTRAHKQGDIKNPLSGDQKVAIASAAGVQNPVTTTPEKPTIFHHLTDLYNQGVQHLHYVHGAGDAEQAKMFEGMQRNNGKEGPHGYYNFKSITAHPYGEGRAEGGKAEAQVGDESTYSGSQMKKAILNGEDDKARAMAPSTLSDKQVNDLIINPVRASMGR